MTHTHIFCVVHGLAATLCVASGQETLVEAAASNIISVDEHLVMSRASEGETTVGRVDVREPEVEEGCLYHY